MSSPILIFGGAGLLGHALTRAAMARGCDVVSLSRAEGDVTQPEQVAAAIERTRPELIFNCAGMTRVDACENESSAAAAVNGVAVGALAKAASAAGARLIHFSTDFVFSGAQDHPYGETDPPDPLCTYGRSKLLGERLLQAEGGENWLMIRTAWLFGSHGRCFPRNIVERACRGEAIRVVNDQIGSPTSAEDVASASLDLALKSAAGIYHVANARSASWFELAVATLKAFGIGAAVLPVGSAEWRSIRPQQAVRPPYSVLKISKVEAALSRPMPAWTDALQRFADQVHYRGSFTE